MYNLAIKSESALGRWMDLQSEVRPKEKNKYSMLMYIYMESRKMLLMNLFAGKEWRHRRRKWTCGHSGEGESGMAEKVASAYIHSQA